IEQDDLRSARTPWAALPPPCIEPIAASFRCEVLVIGAGITGALVAERLTRQGRQVVIIDCEISSLGSTVRQYRDAALGNRPSAFPTHTDLRLRESSPLLSGQSPGSSGI